MIMRFLPFVLLLACPVDSQDIQSQKNSPGYPPPPQPIDMENPQAEGQQDNTLASDDNLPPRKGTPSQTKLGEEPVAIPPNPLELRTPPTPPTAGSPSQAKLGEEPVPIPPDPSELRDPPVGDLKLTEQMQPPQPQEQPEHVHQPGQIETPSDDSPMPQRPSTEGSNAGDVLPIFQRLPSFSNIIGTDSISIRLEVSEVEEFDVEFVVLREDAGRTFPKVLHKQVSVTSPITIQAPANFTEPVWLVITVDQKNDGLTKDDLVGGSKEGIQFLTSDLSLRYQLSNDRDILESMPWYSQASEGPQQPF
jgi:hypothetical protein